MIQFISNLILVRDEEGLLKPFDLDALQRRISESFSELGFSDPFVSNCVFQIVRDYVATHSQNGGNLSRSDVDGVVSKVLMNTGFPDVAAVFRGSKAVSLAAGAQTFSHERLEALLRSQLPATSKDVENLVEATYAKLQAMNLEKVTDALIVELARHLHDLRQEDIEIQESIATTDPVTGLDVDFNHKDFRPQAPELLVEESYLCVEPVSHFLPSARIKIDMLKLGEEIGGAPLTDLHLLPAIHRSGKKITELVLEIQEWILKNLPTSSIRPPNRVSVLNLEEFAVVYFGCESTKKRTALYQKIVGAMRRSIKLPADSFCLMFYDNSDDGEKVEGK